MRRCAIPACGGFGRAVALSLPIVLAVTAAARAQGPFTDIGAGLTGVEWPSLAWGDYDRDGDLDLALAGRAAGGNHITKLYRNDDGSFMDAVAGLQGARYSSLAWGDYDNDGDLDLALSGEGSGSGLTVIYRNDGEQFAEVNPGLIQVILSSLAWGDYDNDGDLDLVVAGGLTAFSGACRIYRNDGNDEFTDIGAGLVGVFLGAVAWGDYDNDGDLDIVVTGTTSGGGMASTSRLYRNEGSDTFVEVSAGMQAVFRNSLAWADYDNDGDLDLSIVGRFFPDGLRSRMYRNNGDGTFTAQSLGVEAVRDCSIVWGDYDNDGDLDIALAGSDVSKVYSNDGGTFTDIGAGLTGVDRASLAWGDYDDDGDLDLALAGQTAGGSFVSRLYRNNGSVFNSPPSAPTGLSTVVSGGDVTFSWAAATDAETPQAGLTYNLLVGTTPGGDEIMSGMAAVGGSDDGKRLIPAMGNVQHNTSWTVKGLPAGTCYWSVQAMDTAFAGSAWAAEGSVVVPGYIVQTPNGDEVWYYEGPDQLVAWTTLSMASNVDIYYSADGGPTWTVVALDIADTGSFTWTIPNEDSDRCLVRVQETGGAGPSDVSNAAFTIVQKTVTVALPASATEGDGTLVGAGTVSIPGTWTADLVVGLSSGDTTELAVPATVTVLQGGTSATFDVTVEDEGEIDGTQSPTVTPTLAGWTGVADSMDVLDNETQTITLTLPASATEGDGRLVGAGTVSIPGTWTSDLVVDLASSDMTELTVPATVTIPQDQTSSTFDLTIVGDGAHDGMQPVTVTATATGWTPGSAEIDIIDRAITPFAGGCVPVASGLAGVTIIVLTTLLVFARRSSRSGTR